MEFADGVVMMGRPGPDYKNPKRLGGVTQSLYVYTDEVDKHFRRAEGGGREDRLRSRPTSSTAIDTTRRKIRRDTSGTSPSTSATMTPEDMKAHS